MLSDIPLTTKNAFHKAKIEFRFSPNPIDSSAAELFDESYEPFKLISAKEIANTFPAGLLSNDSPGGVAGYLDWLESKTTITPEESLKHHEGIDKIWAKFQSIFMVLNGAIWYEPIFRAFVRHLLEKLYEDGIFWVDLRLAFHMSLQEEGTGRILPKTDVLRIFGEVLKDFKSTPEGANFWGARMIWTALRILDKTIIKENMIECMEAKEKYPDLIAGRI